METCDFLCCTLLFCVHAATVPAAEKCSEGTHDCDPNADCIDIEEGYTCHCQPGFTGNGQVCRRTYVLQPKIDVLQNINPADAK